MITQTENHNSRKHWYKLLERQGRIFKVFCNLEYFVLFFIILFFVWTLSFAAACLFHCIALPGCSRFWVDLLTHMAWKIHSWRTRPRTTVVAQKRMLCICTHAIYYVILYMYIIYIYIYIDFQLSNKKKSEQHRYGCNQETYKTI